MINFLLAVTLILFVAILFVFLYRALTAPAPMFTPDTEETTVTTTTTTTVQPTVDQLPPLVRLFKANGQPYVVDPVDGDEWMLNTNDDMYEDAKGNWWRLV